jgi:hypothetical protein
MKIKNQRILKNGAVAGYVYYAKENKWKWRIIGRNNKKGGGRLSLTLINQNDPTDRHTIDDHNLYNNLDEIAGSYFHQYLGNNFRNYNIILRDYRDSNPNIHDSTQFIEFQWTPQSIQSYVRQNPNRIYTLYWRTSPVNQNPFPTVASTPVHRRVSSEPHALGPRALGEPARLRRS